MDILPKPLSDQTVNISSEGLEHILNNYDPNCPERNFLWCSDYKNELPIRVRKSGPGSQKPYTICQLWQNSLKLFPNTIALNYEQVENKWVSVTYKQYFDKCMEFTRAMIALGVTPYATVNIIGFNCPEWAYAFFGSIFGNYLPIGIYTTNGPEACEYIANHSQCEVIVMEDRVHLNKYIKILDKTPKIRYYILWKDTVPQNLPTGMEGKVFTWQELVKFGATQYKPVRKEDEISYRMAIQKPGNCCTFIYTSGTTGPPKAVMISHDNYTWITDATCNRFGFLQPDKMGKARQISMLPLSHVAAQLTDLIIPIRCGGGIFFTDPSALQGNLLKYLMVAKPVVFMTVPRVWQKMEEKMIQVGSQTTGLKRKLADWAKSIGAQGTYAEINGKETPAFWSIAKKLIFNKIKAGLGLDECQVLLYSAAPLRQSTKKFFLNLNIHIGACYGMSELTGPETFTNPRTWDTFKSEEFLKETGQPLSGLELVIDAPDAEGNGQICMRGRNRFMGYFKNEEETRKTIDSKGFLHSGDVGKLNSQGNLIITGRIKELLITAGGENVAPVLIENQLVTNLPLFAHVVVIGDKRKYLTALLTMKVKDDVNLMDDVVSYFSARGSDAKTVQEVIKCKIANKIIQEGIEKANDKAISKAQRIVKYTVLPNQFSTDTDELTPTLKLRRKIITQKYDKFIESMYLDPKL